MKKILVTDKLIVDLSSELEGFKVDIWDKNKSGNLTSQKLSNIIGQYDGIISMLSDDLSKEVLLKATKLKIIAQYAVGYNNIDTNYCKENKIQVTNTPDVLSHATAELAFALLISLARNIKESSENARVGNWKGWEPCGFLGTSLKSLHTGVIGAGRIATEFSHICHSGFGHKISYFSRSKNTEFEEKFKASKMDLCQMLKEVDILSIHCPLNKKTKDLLNYENLLLMKENAIIINTARGEIFNQEDLIKVAKKRTNMKFGLDVTSPEPLDKDNELFSLDNILITPHIGSATYKARQNMGKIVCQSIKDYFLDKELKYSISY